MFFVKLVHMGGPCVVHPLIVGIIIAVISNAVILLTYIFQALLYKLMEPAIC